MTYEYAATTHVKLELSIAKSLPIDGNAIFTLPTLIAYDKKILERSGYI